MSELFITNPGPIGSLLKDIDEGELVLPAFQRKFGWDNQRQDALIRAIINGYPTGNLLLLQYPKGEILGRRLIEGVDPAKAGVFPDRIILDGQQRLTTLYHVLYGKGAANRRRAFIRMRKVEEFFRNDGRLPDSNEKTGIELVQESVDFMTAGMADWSSSSLETQLNEHKIPLTCIFGKAHKIPDGGDRQEIGFDEWKVLYAEHHEPHDQNKRLAIYRKLDEIKRRLIRPIENYAFPVVVLLEKTEPHAVCQVFVDLNIQQKPLNPFEVVTAKVWPFAIDLYREWEIAQEIRSIKQFAVNPVLPLKVIALLQTHANPEMRISCTKRTLYRLDTENFGEMWQKAVDALNKSLLLLEGESGLLHHKWQPYSALLASMAATLIDASEAGIRGDELKSKLLCWYWCSVFAETYRGGTDSQNARDFRGLREWLDGGEAPPTVRFFSSVFNPQILRSTYSGGRYKGVICLLLRNHARDFRTGQRIHTSLLLEEKIEDHHVFPDAFLKRINVEDWGERNCILNRALIDALTNKEILDRKPSSYMADIRARIGSDQLREILASQLLPTDPDAGLLANDYDKFLEYRQEILTQEIAKVTTPPP